MPARSWRLVLSFWTTLLFMASVTVVGCTPRAASKPLEESPIKLIGLLYGQYMGQNRGQSPPNEQAFRDFAAKQEGFLRQFQVQSVDQLFQSSRDGEPYAIVYGNLSKTGQLSGAPIIAWEKKGVNGRRYVVNTLGTVKEVTEEEFAKLVPAP